jgi:hypothetical protein
MRTFTNIFAINGCFGINQNRYAVKMSADRDACAGEHLLAWHAAITGGRFHVLKSRVAVAVTRALLHGKLLLQAKQCSPVSAALPGRQPQGRLSFGYLES